VTTADQEPRRRTATRDKLVAAAASLIPEVGWGGVSARKVAERAGVNLGVVHYHVESMAELRRLAAVRSVRAFFEGPVRLALDAPDPRSGVATLFASLSAGDPRDPQLLLLYESLVAASRDDELRAEIAASLAELRDSLREWLRARGVEHPEAAAVTITAAIDGYLLQRALDPTLAAGPVVEGLTAVLTPPRRRR
jgi:AcrR family transcriptional regulator